jgi:hypothetical protein
MLSGDEAPTKELVKICGEALHVRLTGPNPPPRTAEDIDTCRMYLGTLAGRIFLYEELQDAREFASRWLAEH